MTKWPSTAKWSWLVLVLAAGSLLWCLVFFVISPLASPLVYTAAVAEQTGAAAVAPIAPVPAVPHLATPTPTRALYMTQCVASLPSFRGRLIKLADETEINAIVVDLKDYSGTVVFPSATAVAGGAGCQAKDFAELVKELHDHQLYVIGRLTVFQDPLYTKTHPDQAVQSKSRPGPWKDHKGLSFVDVSAKPYWDYVTAIAREAHALGVDEINFDYVRYPSDGDMSDTHYIETGATHAENLERFFKYLTEQLRQTNHDLILSADLFGMTTTNEDDLGIGQVLERALPYFDFIDPMVYPSHYPPQFNGWANPNQHPYDIVYYSLTRAVARTLAETTPVPGLTHTLIPPPVATTTPPVATSTPSLTLYRKPSYPASKIRPWLQDFSWPVTYTEAMVKAQIKATYDLNLSSWLMWDPANKYTTSVYQATP